MEEKTLSKEDVFDGRIFRLERHTVSLPDGETSVRDIIRHPGAVGVVARTPEGNFVMVRQYRKAIEEITVEVVAGGLDSPDEDPEQCARRELEEETGRRAASLTYLGRIYPTPGYVDEKIELYFAELEADSGEASPDEDEFVEAFECSEDEVERMISADEIVDSKTLSAWLLFRRKIPQNRKPS